MSIQCWTKLEVRGDKIPARSNCATCCIAGTLTEQHSILMVIGGLGSQLRAFGDVWLLDVDAGVWSEVGMFYLNV